MIHGLVPNRYSHTTSKSGPENHVNEWGTPYSAKVQAKNFPIRITSVLYSETFSYTICVEYAPQCYIQKHFHIPSA